MENNTPTLDDITRQAEIGGFKMGILTIRQWLLNRNLETNEMTSAFNTMFENAAEHCKDMNEKLANR